MIVLRKLLRFSARALLAPVFFAFFALASSGGVGEAQTSSVREWDYDVVVAGGGVGGIAAAIQAARLGASVLQPYRVITQQLKWWYPCQSRPR